MNPATTRELRREAILAAHQAVGPLGLTTESLRLRLRHASHEVAAPDLAADIAYLVGKGLLSQAPSPISAASTRTTLTAAGTEYLEAHGY